MEHRAPFKVYYEDTDSLGVVYYANYFKYLERGRAEFLESTGRTIGEWNADGFLLVVHSVQATFRRPATLGDTVEVVTSFTLPSVYRGRFAQRVERAGDVLVDATVDVVCLNLARTLMEFPQGLTTLAQPSA